MGESEVGNTIAAAAAPSGPETVVAPITGAALKPGEDVQLKVTIERRHGFQGRVPVEVRGLPHGALQT